MNKFLNIAFAFLFLTSCTSNSISSDDEPPVISDLSIKGSNDEVDFSFAVGTKITLSSKFVDNQDLGSYKYDIHFAGDGHSHLEEEPSKKILDDWQVTINGDLKGTEENISKTITISELAKAGPYHYMVYCVDRAGNSANFKMQRFLISRADMPTFSNVTPDFDDLEVPAGSNFIVGVDVYALSGLSKITHILREAVLDSEDVIEPISELLDGTSKTHHSEQTIEIPADAKPGYYVLLILASDTNGNVGQEVLGFNVVSN